MRATRVVVAMGLVAVAVGGWLAWRGRASADSPIVVRLTAAPPGLPPPATPVAPEGEPLVDVWFGFASAVPVDVQDVPIANPGSGPGTIQLPDDAQLDAYQARLDAFADAWDAEHDDFELVQRWREVELRSWLPFVTPHAARVTLHARARPTVARER